jgi:DEAD/DEAH box helicase domain-containing protein
LTFKDFLGEFATAFGLDDLRMYRHQYEAMKALLDGFNVILTAGTGSGKTEAWCLLALAAGLRSLVIYPNKALAEDQIGRLKHYATSCGKSVGEIHADKGLITGQENIVASNPAYLMSAIKAHRTPLIDFISKIDLIIFDELAFYSPTQQQLILKLLEIIHKEYSSPQSVILTATLGNVEMLSDDLMRISGRKTKVFEGKPFKRPNKTYIIYHGSIVDYLVELLKCDEDIVSVVFTETVNSAEKLLKKVLTLSKSCPIATHHSRKSRRERKQIQEMLQKGELRVVISPRTLEQGIDIGAVGRVVHYGLPREPFVFIQREGRKGRRQEIPFTETLIFPVKDMDFAILEQNGESLREWLEIGPAKFFKPKENKFIDIFHGLYNLFRHGDESILHTLSVNRRKAANIWRDIQFYGYGYGQYSIYIGGIPLDIPVSRRDFVEEYQPGNIDLTNSGIVIDILRNKIIETEVNKIPDVDKIWLQNALDIYAKVKYSLGERPNFVNDVDSGRIEGKVLLNAKVPNGFDLITEWPEAVVWVIEPKEAEVVMVGGKEVKVKKPVRVWVSDAPIQGSYSYYTYGFEAYVPSDNASINGSALALLIALIRLTYGVPVMQIAGYCTKDKVKIWEREPAGILVSLDYEGLMEKLMSVSYWDRKLKLAVSTVDKEAYLNIQDPNHFEVAREASLRLAKELNYAVTRR